MREGVPHPMASFIIVVDVVEAHATVWYELESC